MLASTSRCRINKIAVFSVINLFGSDVSGRYCQKTTYKESNKASKLNIA